MISAVVLVKNEEKQINDCLSSLDWCDEIIVIDDYSTDHTLKNIEKIKNNKIKIFQKHLDNDFSMQRNFGLEKASGDWIFFVDSDERATVSLQYEILSTINTSINNINGYRLKRKDEMWGKKLEHGEPNSIELVRLARRNAGKWEGAVHEAWVIKGNVGKLDNYLVHYPHPNITEFLEEIDRYSTLRAKELFKQGKKVNILSIIFYPLGKFKLNYFIRLGFLDGIPGLIYTLMMSLHSFLVRGKLWQLNQSK